MQVSTSTCSADSFQRMGVKSAHATEGLGHQRDTSMVLSRSGYEQFRDERIRSRHRAVAELSLGKGSRRDDGFDRVLLSCREGETGATRTNSGEERWLENQREQNTRRGVVPLQRFHCGVAPKRKWLASLAIQVNTKRRYRGCYETHADDQADVKSSHL